MSERSGMNGPESGAPILTLRFLGVFEARVNGCPLRRLHTRKGQALLALLTLRHGREADRDRLAGTLWPDSTETLARSSLRRCLTDLRNALGPEAARLAGPTARTLRFDLAGADVDVLAFDEALRRGEIADLERAVALYRGDLLEGCTEEWVLQERREREEGFLGALEELGRRAEGMGEFAAAEAYRRRVIALSPFRETVHRELIGLLGRTGRHAEGVAVYRNLRLLMLRDLQTEPSAETVMAYRALRDNARFEAKRGGARPHSPRDGAHLEAAGGPHDEATFMSALPLRKLPVPLTGLVGREREVAEVIDRLEESRLVTLVGTGGVGKTRLAIRVAEEVAGGYPDGVAFIDLASLSDESLVVQTVAHVLEVRGTTERTMLESVQVFLRSKALLLVVDNCEHLVRACASLVETLLEGAKHLKVLATSRQALGVTGEWLFRTPSLSLPEDEAAGWNRLEEVGASDAVRLFVERAKAVQGSFRLTLDNARTVATICARLDGIPLALEMVAPRVRTFTPDEILTHLSDRFGFVRSESPTASLRQRTLLSTLDWSYGLLAESERVLLQRLTVFAGGFTREAVSAVCDREGDPGLSVEDGIESLVDKSLLQVNEGSDGRIRFSTLETVWEYGVERLERSGERKAFRRRHADHFIQYAEDMDARLRGPEQREILRRLEAEHNNLRSALGWCLTEGEDPATGLRLVGALHWFWLLRDHYAEGRRWLDLALSIDAREGNAVARAKALQGIGQLSFYLGDSESCRSFLEQSVRLFEETGERREGARSRLYLGAARNMLGDLDGARECLEESIAIGQEEGDAWGLGMALWMLGSCLRTRDEEAAIRYLTESEEVLRPLGDPCALAGPLYYLGDICSRRNDLDLARRYFDEAAGLVRQSEDRFRTMGVLIRLGETLYRLGDGDAAERVFTEGIALFEQWEDPATGTQFSLRRGVNLAEAYLHLGHIYRDRDGTTTSSRSCYERSLALYEQIDDDEGRATARRFLDTLSVVR